MPKTSLVSTPPPVQQSRGSMTLERIVFWDANGNGKLDHSDKKFLFYSTSRQIKGQSSGCIYGCSGIRLNLRIYEKRVSNGEIRKHAVRFRKLVKRGRTQRSWMRRIPPIARGDCYVYSRGVLPKAFSMKFKPPLTRATRLTAKPFKRVKVPRSGVINPGLCRAIDAKYKLPRPDVERKTLPVRITFGGVVFSTWLIELMKTYTLQRLISNPTSRMIASYVFKGVRYLHVGLKP